MTLEVANLGKRFGNKWALRDVNFTLGSGVVGLLGPNGAGKSTLMRLVTTFSKPTEGTVYWHGTDVFDDPSVIRSAVGYLPQRFGVYPNLTAREFLRYLAGIRGVVNTSDRIDDLLALVNLGASVSPRRSCPTRSCSSSTNRRSASTRRNVFGFETSLLTSAKIGLSCFQPTSSPT